MQQISDWLESLGMSEYAERFADNDIDFAILGDLTDQDLEKIGVTSLGHRRKLLRAIANLDGVQKSGPVLAVPATPSAIPADTAERRFATRAVRCTPALLKLWKPSFPKSPRASRSWLHAIALRRALLRKPYSCGARPVSVLWQIPH
jgi:SAM domain (Sterile alpha motif)